ncbi:MAG: hypothetical protein QN163_07565 [Armatimonadota bacterium]|nr:hypothetical protein [Armatimonadota bacterium]MDR5696177.1 hypothetical protein [Armatimonadota bacterium]
MAAQAPCPSIGIAYARHGKADVNVYRIERDRLFAIALTLQALGEALLLSYCGRSTA